MSNFDELFNSVENTEMVKDLLNDTTFSKLRSGVVEALARDSKIKLVTPYDKERPLDTGAYWYDSDENTLYVGISSLIDELQTVLSNINIKCNFSHMPAPRIKCSVLINRPVIDIKGHVTHMPAPRIVTALCVPSINTSINGSSSLKNHYVRECVNQINRPNITISMEV